MGPLQETLPRSLTALALAVVLTACAPASAPGEVTPSTGTPATSPSETPEAFVPAIPISLPVPVPYEESGITFDNAIDHLSEIPEAAWTNIQNAIEGNEEVRIDTRILIGPKTDTTQAQIEALLQREYRLWDGFSQPSSYVGLVYNADDIGWAEDAWRDVVVAEDYGVDAEMYLSELRAGCEAGVECWGGMAETFPGSSKGFSFYGVQEPFWNDENQDVGPMSQVNHEYTHNVQFAQWIGTGQDSTTAAHAVVPCWWQEGQANAIGFAVWAPTYAVYKGTRDYNVTRPIDKNGPQPTLTSFGAQVLDAFLDQDTSTCYNPGTNGDYQLGFSVGYAAVEVLVAIGGPQATMAVVARTASGDTWSEAFEAVYGITWEEGRASLAKILAAEYAADPLRSS